MIATVN